jgi:hypothetical protein
MSTTTPLRGHGHARVRTRVYKAFAAEEAAAQYVGSISRVTSKGVDVELKLYRNVPDGIKEGWVVDLVEAHTEQGLAGYLKLSYIPKENMERWYPNPFIWWAREGGNGWEWSLREFIDKDESLWSREELLTAIEKCDSWPYLSDSGEWKTKRASLSIDELRNHWRERKQIINDQHAQDYQQFRRYWLNHPVVDFIRVHNGGRDRPYVNGVRQDDWLEVADSRRQGIATVLYETGVLWMHTRNMPMYASSLQSEEAKKVWSHFRKRGLVRRVRNDHGIHKSRLLFDAKRLLAEQPQLRFDMPNV